MIHRLTGLGRALWAPADLLLRLLVLPARLVRPAPEAAPAPAGASLVDRVPPPTGSPFDAAVTPAAGAAAVGSDGGLHTRLRRRALVAAGYVASVAAVAALAGGVTFGFFSATTSSSSSSFSAGTVSLSSSASGQCGVAATDVLPDGSAHTCTLTVTYGGNKPAYLGVDVLIATKAGTGGTPLYHPSDSSNEIQVTVADDQPLTYVDPSGPTDFGSPVACPAPYDAGGYTCYRLTDLLVSKTPFTSGSVAFATTLSIPTTSTSDYQGGEADVVITVHATQSDNNGSVSGCTAGLQCLGVSWS